MRGENIFISKMFSTGVSLFTVPSQLFELYFLRGIYFMNMYFSHDLSQVAKAEEMNITSSPCYSWDNS